jgi:hypothetical protein
MKSLQQRAKESLDFLRAHPAISWDNGDSLFSGMWFHMEECCKHGKSAYAGKFGIDVWEGMTGWERFKDKIDAEYADEPNYKFKRIVIPYEEYYGEPWAFDHVEYWYEITFFVYTGELWSNDSGINSYLKHENWSRFAGPTGGANSFDEMLIDCATKVREVYGEFNKDNDSMLTVEEIAWRNRRYSLDSPRDFLAEINDGTFRSKHIDIHDGILNLRWLKWFITTDYAKENWRSYCFERSNEENYDYPLNPFWPDLIKKLDQPDAKYENLVLGYGEK